jgi:hypothetical protein
MYSSKTTLIASQVPGGQNETIDETGLSEMSNGKIVNEQGCLFFAD